MIALSFLAGIIVGAACILFLAAWLGRSKPQQAKEAGGILCAGLGDVTMEASNAYLLKQILSEIDKTSLYEIKTRVH
jgi:hypothetical protein